MSDAAKEEADLLEIVTSGLFLRNLVPNYSTILAVENVYNSQKPCISVHRILNRQNVAGYSQWANRFFRVRKAVEKEPAGPAAQQWTFIY